MVKLKIKKGDDVVVITGKYRKKQGKVLEVLPARNKVKISGVNLHKKHKKPSKSSEGGMVYEEGFIDVSNVSHIDPKTGIPTKVCIKTLEDGSKVRVAKKSGEIIDKEGKW